eukprot:GDKI01025518.1.p3 GENE.GDKI01025518.1~~GDKI01025518.1.p3  ORF type:complete len:122 (-),score=42.51 GDKI01025518.1:215-580(-)
MSRVCVFVFVLHRRVCVRVCICVCVHVNAQAQQTVVSVCAHFVYLFVCASTCASTYLCRVTITVSLFSLPPLFFSPCACVHVCVTPDCVFVCTALFPSRTRARTHPHTLSAQKHIFTARCS